MPGNWSSVEVEAAVADYFAMLEMQLRGEAYEKAAHSRALSASLDGRSKGSIEYKHQNISAVLIELGYPWLSGYPPRYNYQRLLAEVVAARVATDATLASAVTLAVDEPAATMDVDSILGRLDLAPEPRREYGRVRERIQPTHARPPVNYLEREARNASLGRAGEEFVMRFEQARLRRLGAAQLADKVGHVAAVLGDGLGFDVRSFEADGRDRLIEVKTTAYGKQTPFFLSKNELEVSRDMDESYYLYRVFRYREDPHLFIVPGALDRSFVLEAVAFSAGIA